MWAWFDWVIIRQESQTTPIRGFNLQIFYTPLDADDDDGIRYGVFSSELI